MYIDFHSPVGGDSMYVGPFEDHDSAFDWGAEHCNELEVFEIIDELPEGAVAASPMDAV